MKYQDLIKNILAGKIASVYLFYGDETYFIEEGVGKIEKKYVSSGSASFNRDVFYGEEADASQIINTAMSIPMLAQHRVVTVKNFQRLPQSGKEMILKYSQRPSPQATLILIADKIDLRKKVYAGLKETTQFVECKSLYDNQVPIYIQQFAKDHGKSISTYAIQLLQAKLGNSLRELINETEKLIHFVKSKKEIEVKDVEELVGISRNYNIFQLWDALGEKNLTKSLIILRQMIETGERPVFIISSLTNYFLRLWRIRVLKRKQVSDSEIGKMLHIHQYFVKSSVQQAKRYNDVEIKFILKLLLDADVQLKTSYQKPKIVLELLVLQIMKKKQKELGSLTDEDLIFMFQEGEMLAFEEIVKRYKDSLMNFIFRFLGDVSESEDIVQETFMRVFRNKRAYKKIAKFSTWIYTIAGNLAKTELRKRKKRNLYSVSDIGYDEKDFEISDETASPESKTNTKMYEDIIQQEIQQLSPKFREVIILRDIQELSYEEISKIIKVPLGTVKSRVNRARLRLQEKLKFLMDKK